MFSLEEIKKKLTSLSPVLKVVISVAVGILITAVIAYAGNKLYHYWHDKPVTTMSQEEAETPKGVETASQNAGVPVSPTQAKEVAREIQVIRETEQVPVYVVQSTGATVEKDSEKAVKDNHADFAILTDPSDKDKEVDISSIPEDTKVELNQYNVQAYKPVIRQVEVGKSPDGDSIVGFTISKKVSKDGQYLGVGVDHVFGNDNKTYIKVVYSW